MLFLHRKSSKYFPFSSMSVSAFKVLPIISSDISPPFSVSISISVKYPSTFINLNLNHTRCLNTIHVKESTCRDHFREMRNHSFLWGIWSTGTCKRRGLLSSWGYELSALSAELGWINVRLHQDWMWVTGNEDKLQEIAGLLIPQMNLKFFAFTFLLLYCLIHVKHFQLSLYWLVLHK